jgi:ribosomal protein S18 acetylase RimI-like enzyme
MRQPRRNTLGNLSVRRYQASDSASVQQIAADTAWFGWPVERFMEDRRLFFDLVYASYLRLAPEHIWLAEAEGSVAGFILGVPDTAAHRRRALGSVLPGVLMRVVLGRYRLGPQTRRYVRMGLRSAILGERVQADLQLYPAHLHINLLAEWRGQGGGRLMMETFLAGMCELGVAGVHLHTTDQNTAACLLYEKLGFTLLDERRTCLWADSVSGTVRSRCYGRRLPG